MKKRLRKFSLFIRFIGMNASGLIDLTASINIQQILKKKTLKLNGGFCCLQIATF